MGITQVALTNFVREHPDTTSKEVAAHFKATVRYAATRLKQMSEAERIFVSSTSRTITNRVRNHYRVVPVAADALKPERKKAAKAVENQRIPTPESTLVKAPPAVFSLDLSDTVRAIASQLVDNIVANVVAAVHADLAIKLAASLPSIEVPALPAPAKPKVPSGYDDAKVVAASAAPVVTVQTRKIKVGVVGLLPQQCAIIDKEFNKDVDLRYWRDGSNSLLKSMGAQCDYVFVTKWAGHSDSETLKSVGANYKFLPGGLESLRDAITDAFVASAK